MGQPARVGDASIGATGPDRGHVQVLGRLVITDDEGRSVPIRSRRRLALERLLLSLDRPVDLGDLAAAVWPDGTAPAQPYPALQVVVSRLRRDLVKVRSLSIERTGTGYRLRADAGSTDMGRLAAAVEAVESGHPPGPDDRSLADGAPFQGFAPGPVLDREVERVAALQARLRSSRATTPGPVPAEPVRSTGEVGPGAGAAPPADVPRAALLEHLADVLRGGVAVVVGPAGAGKSTLVHQVRALAPRSCCISLVPGSNDAARFHASVVHAIRTVEPTFLMGIESVTPGTPLYTERFVAELDRVGSGLLVAFDDIHVLEDPTVIDFLDEVVRWLPPFTTVVLAGRRRPPVRLGRLRLAGRVAEVGPEDLAADRQEAAAIVRRLRPDCTDTQIDQLLDETDGWIAGLILRTIGADDDTAGRRFGHGDSDLVLQFVEEEILDELHEELRQFLVETSLLGAFDVGLAARATERPVGRVEALIDDALARALFLSTDGDGTWRYHDLFAAALRGRAALLPARRRHDIRIRAVTAHRDAGRPDDALALAADAEDTALVMDILASPADATSLLPYGIELAFTDRRWTSHRWARWIEERDVAPTALQSLMGALQLLADGRVQAALAKLDDYDRLRDRSEPAMPGWQALRAGCLLELGDADEALEEALASLEDAISVGWGEEVEIGVGMGCAHPMLHSGDYAGAERVCRDLIERSHRLPELPGSTPALYCILGLAQVLTDQVAEAQETFDELLSLSDRVVTRDIYGSTAVLAGLLAARTDDPHGGLTTMQHWTSRPGGVLEGSQIPVTHWVRAILLRMTGDHAAADDEFALGDATSPPRTSMRYMDHVRAMALPDPDAPPMVRVTEVDLSLAEERVLQLLRSDLTLREIAAELDVSVNTVKTHTRSVYRKLGVTSRAAAVAISR